MCRFLSRIAGPAGATPILAPGSFRRPPSSQSGFRLHILINSYTFSLDCRRSDGLAGFCLRLNLSASARFCLLPPPNILPNLDDVKGWIGWPVAKVHVPIFRSNFIFAVPFWQILTSVGFRQLPLASASGYISHFRRHYRRASGAEPGAKAPGPFPS